MTLVEVERRIAARVLVLNRPERHNSLVPEMLEELLSALEDAGRDPKVRAVVLSANGPSFSTGGDVQAFFDHGDDVGEYATRIVGLLNETILAMIDLPVPVVAAVHGMVTGGSLGLVLASDVVLVADEASFAPWYPVVGFSPDGGWTAMLPQVIGRAKAAETLLRNRTITANEAVAWGMAAAVVPGIGIQEEALAVAAEISGMVPGAIRGAKALLRADRDATAAGLESELRRFVRQIVTDEAREGMARFVQRAGDA